MEKKSKENNSERKRGREESNRRREEKEDEKCWKEGDWRKNVKKIKRKEARARSKDTMKREEISWNCGERI